MGGWAGGTGIAGLGRVDRESVRELERRTRTFAIDVVRLTRALGRDPSLWPVLSQVARSAGSVSANHLAVAGARSLKELHAKLSIVYEEAAESAHWLSLLQELGTAGEHRPEVDRLLSEAERLRNLFGKARATTRERLRG